MADAYVGPLAETPVAVLKPCFMLAAKDIFERAGSRFFGFKEGTKQSDLKQDHVLNVNNIKKKKERRRIFRGWRLPRLGWDEEMKAVKEWILECQHCRALNVDTVEEAFDIVRGLFITCKKHKSETYYEVYPSIREISVVESGARNAEEPDRTDEQGSTSITNGNVLQRGNVESQTDTVLELCSPQAESPNDDGLDDSIAQCALELFTTASSKEDMMYYSHIKNIISAARNDKPFFFLCKINEDVADCKIDFVAAALLDLCEAEDLNCDILVTDALHYASARQKGVTDLALFHLRKHRVPANIAYQQMQTYSRSQEQLFLERDRMRKWDGLISLCLCPPPNMVQPETVR